jgi:hypothetical protein
MSIDAFPALSEQSPGITVTRRSPLSVFPVLVCDPSKALPPKVYRGSLVYSGVANRQRVFCRILSFFMRPWSERRCLSAVGGCAAGLGEGQLAASVRSASLQV